MTDTSILFSAEAERRPPREGASQNAPSAQTHSARRFAKWRSLSSNRATWTAPCAITRPPLLWLPCPSNRAQQDESYKAAPSKWNDETFQFVALSETLDSRDQWRVVQGLRVPIKNPHEALFAGAPYLIRMLRTLSVVGVIDVWAISHADDTDYAESVLQDTLGLLSHLVDERGPVPDEGKNPLDWGALRTAARGSASCITGWSDIPGYSPRCR